MIKIIFRSIPMVSWVLLFFLEGVSWACGSKPAQVADPALQVQLLEKGQMQRKVPIKKKSLISRVPGSRLNPPWWLIHGELVNSIGATPGVVVGEPELNLSQGRVRISDLPPGVLEANQKAMLSIWIYPDTRARAAALAFVLKSAYSFQSTNLSIWVNDPENPGVPIAPPQPLPQVDLVSFVQQNLQVALDGNPYFKGFSPRMNSPLMPNFFILFSREEIQFFADNIGDAYRNVNAVAEDIFADLMNIQFFNGLIRVGVSTVLKSAYSLEPSAPLHSPGL